MPETTCEVGVVPLDDDERKLMESDGIRFVHGDIKQSPVAPEHDGEDVEEAAAAAEAATETEEEVPCDMPPAPTPRPEGPTSTSAGTTATGNTPIQSVGDRGVLFFVRLRWVPAVCDGRPNALAKIWITRWPRALMSCPVIKANLYPTLNNDGNTSTSIELVWRTFKVGPDG